MCGVRAMCASRGSEVRLCVESVCWASRGCVRVLGRVEGMCEHCGARLASRVWLECGVLSEVEDSSMLCCACGECVTSLGTHLVGAAVGVPRVAGGCRWLSVTSRSGKKLILSFLL